jgi:hypothetical protein
MTYLATFRAIVKKYPMKEPLEILEHLIADSPGDEGKWFAAARSAGFYEKAIELANSSPCDPKTLITAMTLTSPSCPSAEVIPGEVEQKLKAIEGVNEVKVEVTFDPPYAQDMMSEAAKLELGFL